MTNSTAIYHAMRGGQYNVGLMQHLPRFLPAVLFLGIAIAGGAWFVAAGPGRGPDEPTSATVFTEPRPLPAFRLRDHANGAFTKDDLLGHTSLLFFGFTHCPDICPATLQQLALARRELAAARNSEALPEIVLISVDPARDTPERLARYVDYFGSGVTGVTGDAGDMGQLRLLTADLGVHFEQVPPARDREEGDDYTVNHTSAVFVVDPQARLQAVFSAPHDIESFVRDLPWLMAAR